MGIFNRSKEKEQVKQLTQNFKLVQGYSPVHTTFDGGMYELSLVRSAIDVIATHCSKLNPTMSANKNYVQLKKLLNGMPNRLMTTQQFLYKLTTILLVENNAFIIPVYDNYSNKIVGLYPIRSEQTEIKTYNGVEYLQYKINNKTYAEEYSLVGHLKRFFYKKDYYGESNTPIKSTMDLIRTQEEGIKYGIKAGAGVRFLARLGVIQNDESIKKEQQRIRENQLSVENSGGALIFDSKYAQVQPIDSKPYIVDDRQMGIIKQNIFDYFHVSQNVLNSCANEDEWNAFYESVIEPIAIQISQVLTRMLIKTSDIERGFNIILEANKLQFISTNTKLQVSQTLFDRGIISVNQVNDIWNLPRVPDEEDKRYIRREYAEVNLLNENNDNQVVSDVVNTNNETSEN